MALHSFEHQSSLFHRGKLEKMAAVLSFTVASALGCTKSDILRASHISSGTISQTTPASRNPDRSCINVGQRQNPVCLDLQKAHDILENLVTETRGNALRVARCVPLAEKDKTECLPLLVINTETGPVYSINAAFDGSHMAEPGKLNLEIGQTPTVFMNAFHGRFAQEEKAGQKQEFLIDDVKGLKIDRAIAEVLKLEVREKTIVVDHAEIKAKALIFTMKNSASLKEMPKFFIVSGTKNGLPVSFRVVLH